ncbi:MAG TPA: phospholipase D-like domain-containing protein [Blastocatellia bacterium]|jgi:phosphatidylserine/phosphatidylglycerophosphate/cardiolipin synthase-like enzyme|nr:phospholipase D-like domain-containing protein [Blastocatellia bacterium]
MNDFENQDKKDGFSMKLRRGERMCLLGFDVDNPEPDFVGFAIESRQPGTQKFQTLLNRLAFSYDEAVEDAVTGGRLYPSTEAPFQIFRWIHFPKEPKSGTYTYRATKMHMPKDGVLERGTSIELKLPLNPVTYDGFLDVGFTRNFASSQAFIDKFPKGTNMDKVGSKIIPGKSDDGLKFPKMPGDIYKWLGFEAHDLLFEFLNEAVKDKTVTLDVFAYDLNEPDMVERLEKMGKRLRAIIDDSTSKKDGDITGHGIDTSAESQAAARLQTSAGDGKIKRTHFNNLQHHKVLIARRNDKPFKVLVGSTNFSFRGIYIQANNMMVFNQPDIAGLFGQVFDAAFKGPAAFKADEVSTKWHLVKVDGKPPVHLCFSPHTSSDLSLNPVRGAIDQATSSVLYSIAFLNQVKSGPTKEALDRLMKRPIFSYGIVDSKGNLEVRKPDGSIGLVDFAFLAKNAPEPFKSEWGAGRGINVHHKFVVTDFSLPTAKLFTGSSNLAPSGEKGNGDHLIMIEDCKVATSYAIEAVRVFDHLHFRTRMKDALKATNSEKKAVQKLTLRKPKAISGRDAWFERFYVPGSQREGDRKLFSR